jgi:hypothetical protein
MNLDRVCAQAQRCSAGLASAPRGPEPPRSPKSPSVMTSSEIVNQMVNYRLGELAARGWRDAC